MTSDTARGLWWLGYAVVFSVIWLLGALLMAPSPLGVANAIFNGICLIGLWGYIRQKAVASSPVWAVMLALQVITAILSVWMSLADGVPVGLVLVGVVLSIPMLVGLYRYSFQSAALWDTKA